MSRNSTFDIEAWRNEEIRTELEHRTKVTPAMLHSINKDGLLISVSDAWLDKLGYTREEVIGRRSSEFLTAESRAYALREVLPAFFLTGHSDNIEYQMVCKNGRIIDVLLSAVLDRLPGEAQGVSLAVITDVTALKAAKRQLALSEVRYRDLVESQTELVSLASPEGELRFVNHAYARHYGREPDEMIGKSLFDFIPETSRLAVEHHLGKVCSVDHSIENQNQVVLPDGRVRWMAWTNKALRDLDGQVTAIHSVGRDIHDRVVGEQRLKESEARYRLLANHGTDMVFQLDVDLVHRYVSPACYDILGREAEELIGTHLIAITHPEDTERAGSAFQSLVDGDLERHLLLCRLRHRDGRWIWVEAQLKALMDRQSDLPSGIIGTLRDVSERKAIEEQLQEANRRLQTLADQDGLTGLSNRRLFDAAFSREFDLALEGEKDLALLMIDVDWFKSFNDGYGHPAGDRCLKKIGESIRDRVRPGDIVARYGGEEFAVLLPTASLPEAIVIGELIRKSVLQLAIEHKGSPNQFVTVSIGVASLEVGNSSRELLLGRADSALYRAKENGRNIVVRDA
ncbi:sensor domain-containing diguanylate cyclase [Rhizobium miluonense]|uniref:PAS domain S-box-containing protein/diguanylate cyclase (GGDEF) domain-containing protein n=1 Tax=Rhizobium miluonense TaxID=411945 RepID=A0A1C3X7W0_9HYPH|nr:sensor domain-containing diguanylate cyclase [Rhizobium miluonense]SCB48337.1 PAS domain S-box-containing protein/diguanylate cyclase (GGDEF) domain-containing protein [Rhizobium miluonense]